MTFKRDVLFFSSFLLLHEEEEEEEDQGGEGRGGEEFQQPQKEAHVVAHVKSTGNADG